MDPVKSTTEEFFDINGLKIEINFNSDKNQKLEVLHRTLNKLNSQKSNKSHNSLQELHQPSTNIISEHMVRPFFVQRLISKMHNFYTSAEFESLKKRRGSISDQESISSIVIPNDAGLNKEKLDLLGRCLSMNNKFKK